MKILLGYSYYPYFYDIRKWVNSWIGRLNKAGFQIDAFPLTLNPPGNPMPWDIMDKRWRLGDRQLMKLYEELALKLENYDVFLNWNGINVHPEFLKYFSTINVYACFDDPESSEIISKPVARYYDLCMIGNIAEVETYKKWGVKNAYFWPLGFMESDFNPNLSEKDFYTKKRDIEITFLGEKKFIPSRVDRLNHYATAFPNGTYYGQGWAKGIYPEEKKVELYQRTKIGPNFHNSTGPINFRTYILPANGVLQICDNKSNLGKIFELNKEAVGFDTVEEAIDKTHYYLAHENERIEIAQAGWKRAIKEYNETAVFSMMVEKMEMTGLLKKEKPDLQSRIKIQRRKNVLKRMIYYFKKK